MQMQQRSRVVCARHFAWPSLIGKWGISFHVWETREDWNTRLLGKLRGLDHGCPSQQNSPGGAWTLAITRQLDPQPALTAATYPVQSVLTTCCPPLIPPLL